MHSRRQAAYRARQVGQLEKVTHQGSPQREDSETVSACERVSIDRPGAPDSASGIASLPCTFCRQRCRPVVRHDFLRSRRPRFRRWRHDPAAARG